MDIYDIFLEAPPGLEAVAASEAREEGFLDAKATPGGVATTGGWADIWRANIRLRTANRVLVRLGAARVTHFAQLDRWSRSLPWAAILGDGAAVKVDATSRRSKLHHTGGVAQRVETAARAALGSARTEAAPFRIAVRIERDQCVVSLDASGAPLHQRGHKLAVGKAPLRETLAAAFLRMSDLAPGEPLFDPMCGSGTFVLEAAAAAADLAPGRDRSFDFERLPSVDRKTIDALRASSRSPRPAQPTAFGSDRDAGAVDAASANATRAGVDEWCRFERRAVSEIEPPVDRPGLIAVNPPYGARIGDAKRLGALYAAFGDVVRERFVGWRVALVTSASGLARATGLPFAPPGPPIPHGGLKVRLFLTDPIGGGAR